MYENLHQSENYEQLSEELFVNEPDTRQLLIFLNRYGNNTFENYLEFFIDPDTLEQIPTGTCTPFSKKMFVTVNGKIIQCERIDHNFALGRITESGVEPDPEKAAEFFNSRISKLYRQCSVCHARKNCTQCIYYLEGIEGDHPVCKGYMDKKMFERYAAYNLDYLSRHPHLYRKLMEEVLVS